MIAILVMMILINAFFVGWIVYLLRLLVKYSDFYGKLLASLKSYESHLEFIKDLLNYYGDQDIVELLEHTKELKDSIGKIYEQKN
jgi:hypothetical protein